MNNINNSWSQKKIIKYISENRKNYNDLYLGEKILLNEYFKKGFSVLDVGCAQGGFVNILSQREKKFSYLGIDYNEEMLAIAKKKQPKYKFINIKKNNFSKYINQKFDLVIIFGILHLNKDWKKIIKEGYKLTKKYLIFDLRESDKKISKNIYLNLGDSKKKIPYNIIETKKIENFLKNEFKNKKIVKVSYGGLSSKYSNHKSKITFGNYCLYK
tara:strand:- start:1203 stop:1844 length:642 start_codon:yes stop_codon:yes gene_type:complete